MFSLRPGRSRKPSRPMRERSRVTAVRAIDSRRRSTVVRGGEAKRAASMSSKPARATSLGTLMPLRVRTDSTPTATTSLKAPRSPAVPHPHIDALRVQGIPGTDGVALVGSASNRCADIDKNTIVNGTQAQIWDCSGGSNETFTQTSRGELVVYGNKCLDADNNDTINGTKVIISDCTGGTNQKWTVNSGSTITNNLSGLCLDATNAATANGTKLLLWTCNGQNQPEADSQLMSAAGACAQPARARQHLRRSAYHDRRVTWRHRLA